MAGSRQIEVKIVGDSKDLSRAFSDASRSADKFGHSVGGKLTTGLKTLAVAGAAAGVAIGAAFAKTVQVGVKSLMEHEEALAQTNAVLKSTGKSANVTAKDILTLSDALEKQTGIDDVLIQKGENLLLTFCLEESAEALTLDRGWVRHDELNAGDWILGYDPDDDCAKWQQVESMHRFLVNGDLIRWKSKQIDVATTPNHRWWTVQRDERLSYKPQFRTTEEISGHNVAVMIGGGQPGCFAETAVYSDELVELLGWVVTEGWVNWLRPSTPNQNGCGFSQSDTANPEKVTRIRDLVARLRRQGHEISETRAERGWGKHSGVAVALSKDTAQIAWTFGKSLGKTLKTMAPEKKLRPELLSQLTAGQARILLDTLIAGDGSTDRSGARIFIQKDEQQLGIVAMLCAMLGIRTSVQGRGDALQLCKTNRLLGHHTNAHLEHYEGIVWCPHLRTGIFMARCNGRTFWTGNTNIRNEVGKGNDIFDQATKAALDMSVAMGTDMQGAVIQVGKALNDPIKGITALTRVGVTFTEQQKDQIKALVESGKSMEAQKLILAELNKEFGGSAVAQGNTFAGMINKIKNSFEEVAEKIAGKLMPHLKTFAGFIGKIFKADSFTAGLKVAIDGIKNLGADLMGAITGLVSSIDWSQIGTKLASLLEKVIDFRNTALAWAGNLLNSAIEAIGAINWGQVGDAVANGAASIVDALIGFVRSIQWGELVANLVSGLSNAISSAMQMIVPRVPGLLIALGGALLNAAKDIIVKVGQFWVSHPELLFGPLGVLIRAIGPKILSFAVEVGAKAAELGRKIIDGIVDGVKGIAEKVGEFFQKIPGAIAGFAERVGSAARNIGERIINALANGIVGLVGKVQEKFQDLWGWIRGAADSAGTFAANVGKAIVQGVWNGITSLAGWLKDKIFGWAAGLLDGALSALGIGSPSKVFAERVGHPIAQGIAKGIRDGGGDVTRALSDIMGLGGGTVGGMSTSNAVQLGQTIGRTVGQSAQQEMVKWFNFSSVGPRHATDAPAGSAPAGWPALDFMGDSPFRSPVSGVISKVGGRPGYSGGFGGRTVYITDNKGNQWFISHVDWGTSMGLKQGQKVSAGQMLAAGGAEPGAAHLHVASPNFAAVQALASGGGQVPAIGGPAGAGAAGSSQAFQAAQAGAQAIGLSMGSLNQAIGSIPGKMEQAAQKIAGIMEKIGTTFNSLKDKALASFDRITEGHVSASRKLLNERQAAHDEEMRIQQRHDLELAVQQATTAEERMSAERALREFDFQESQRLLEEKAVMEEQEWEKSREKQRNRLEKDLEKWLSHLGNKNKTTKEKMQDLMQILHKGGLDGDEGFMRGISGLMGKLKKFLNDLMGEVGTTVSNANAALGSVGSGAPTTVPASLQNLGTGSNPFTTQPTKAQIDAAKAIARMNHENRSPAQKQALADFNAQWGAVTNWKRGGIFGSATMGIFGEAGAEALVPLDGPAAKMFAKSGAGRAVMGSMASHTGQYGNTYITIMMPNYVGDEQTMMEAARRALVLEGKRSGTALGSYA